MKNILHITSSPRGKQSYSNGLSTAIVEKLKAPDTTIVERNLCLNTPPYINPGFVDELYKNPIDYDQKSALLLEYSDIIFHEVKNTDIIVIGTPMHNMTVSAPLKAWIDLLIRHGITYGYDNTGKRTGYLQGKKVYLAVASGSRLSDWPAGSEFIESYIKSVFGAYTGITDIRTFRVEGTVTPDFSADYNKILETL